MSNHSSFASRRSHAGSALFAAAAVVALAATGCASVANSAAPAPTVAPIGPAVAVAPSAHIGGPEQANTVNFAPSSGLNVSYSYDMFTDGYRVSDGQPWGGIASTPSTSDTTATVTAYAGQSYTAMPALWFTGSLANRWGDHPDAASTAGYSGELPGHLFFAFTGDLIINGNSYNVAIGEGKADSVGHAYDDWWIGGTPTEVNQHSNSWTTVNTSNGTALITPDGKYEIAPRFAGASTFDVVPYQGSQG